MPPLTTRRQALRSLALFGAGAMALPVIRAEPATGRTAAKNKPEAMRLAFVGVGGQGAANLRTLTRHRFAAFADVDDTMAAPAYRDYPDVPRYRDFRRLLDRHAGELDGVIISTPDHSHHPIARAVMAAGLNVYIEKPLATTIWECRDLAEIARRQGVRTQLGVQGHHHGALRVLREWLDAGAIGPVRTVYLWTDRMQPVRYTASDALALGETPPPTLDWDLWLADRPSRPYSPLYVPNRWRNWWNFGTGPLGDIGAHMFDVVEFALEVGFPDLVEAETPWRNAFTAPPWSRVRWAFPARGNRPPLVIHWCNGTRNGAFVRPEAVPRLPAELISSSSNGMAFVGDDGTAFIPDMRASSVPRIFPPEREADVLAHRPLKTLPRPKGTHFDDWFSAIRDGREAGANFDFGAPLTEVVLLGQLAQRTALPIRWDRAAMRAINNPEADALIRPPLRTDENPAS